MSYNSLFKVILRVLGLVAILQFIQMAFENYAQFSYFIKEGDALLSILGMLLVLFLLTVLYGLSIYFLVLRTEDVIRFFGLDKGFKEDVIKTKVSARTVYKTTVIFFGFYLVLMNLPVLAKKSFLYFQSRVEENFELADYAVNVLYENLIFTILGLVLISEQKKISNFLYNMLK